MSNTQRGFVYFLQVQPYGPIKIGYAGNSVVLRVQSLQASSPYELKWIGAFVGTLVDERAAHKQFAQWRVRGEWFHPVLPVLEFVRDKSADFDPIRIADEVFCEPDRLIACQYFPPWSSDRQEKRNEVAQQVGLTGYEISRWISRELALDPDITSRIAEYVRNQVVAS